MKNREEKLLLAIIDNFIRTAVPVGSKTIVREYKLKISSSTVRNEMVRLEDKGLICHPHTSSGRVPTAKGYRFFVESVKASEKDERLARKDFAQQVEQYRSSLDRQRVYRAVDILARVVDNIAFATLPGNAETIFLGMSNVLKQPEFLSRPYMASRVFEVLERGFLALLESIEVDDDVRIYIGEENLIEQFQSCSMLITRCEFGGKQVYIGVLGPMRMRYSYNKTVLEQAREFLHVSN